MHTENFDAHPVWSLLNSLFELLARIDTKGDAAVSRRLDEVRELAAYTKSFATSEERQLFSASMLDDAANAWQTVSSHLEYFESNPAGYANYLDVAVGQLDTVRNALSRWPLPKGNPASRAALTRAMNDYRAAIDSSRAALVKTLATQADEANARERNLASQINELQNQVQQITRALDNLESRIIKDEARLDTALTANNEAFNTGQSAKEQAFKDWLRTQEVQFAELAQPHLQNITEAASTAKEALVEVKGLRKSTVDMSQLAAGDILADQYASYAQSERVTSYWAYGIGIFAAIGSIAIILFAFGWVRGVTEWETVVLKLALTAAAGSIAAVAFRFGGQATRRATSFKRQELELRALQPFLKDVEGADRAKTSFLERAFGHAWTESTGGKSEPEMNDALLKLLTAARCDPISTRSTPAAMSAMPPSMIGVRA